MLIVYDNLFEAKPLRTGERVSLRADASPAGSIALSMSTECFKVEYEDGEARVSLHRNLTNAEARALAEALLARLDRIEKEQKQWVTVSGNAPLPPGVKFSEAIANRATDDHDCDG